MTAQPGPTGLQQGTPTAVGEPDAEDLRRVVATALAEDLR